MGYILRYFYFILSIILFLCSECSCNLKIHVESADLEAVDSEYMNVKVNIRPEGADNLIDIKADVLKDIGNDIFIQIHFQKLEDNGSLTTVYKSPLVDRCHFVENRDKYPIINLVFTNFEKYGNMMQNCPIMKGNYNLNGYKYEINDDNKIVSMMTAGNYVTHFLMTKEIDTQIRTLLAIKWKAKFIKI